jgi:hypothetical protein
MERFNGTPNTTFIVNLSGRPTLDGTVSVIDLPRRKLLGKIKTPRPRQTSGRETLASLLQDADVFVQGYRPGAIAGFGFDPSGLPRPNDGNRRRAVFGIMRQVDGGGPDPSAIARVVGLNRAAADRFWNEEPFSAQAHCHKLWLRGPLPRCRIWFQVGLCFIGLSPCAALGL